MESKMKCNIAVNLFTPKNYYCLACPQFIFPESNIKVMKEKKLSTAKQVFGILIQNSVRGGNSQ